MNAPVILPSYVPTLLEAQRADADRTTQTMSEIRSPRKNANVHSRPESWLMGFLRTSFWAFDRAWQRVLARAGSQSK